MNDFETLKVIVKELVGNSVLYFDTPVEINATSMISYRIWAICVDPKNKVHIMDSDQNWGELEDSTEIEKRMIKTLHDRMVLIRFNFINL
jgi:hypothetical protein